MVSSAGIDVFVSHAVLDTEIADIFVSRILVQGLGIPPGNILCTSVDGTKIASGEDWRATIRSTIMAAKASVLLITSNYKNSEMCQNELGAVWASECRVFPVSVPPITYDSVGVLQKVKEVEVLTEETGLDRLRDAIVGALDIDLSKIPTDYWTKSKKQCISDVESHVRVHHFPAAVSKEILDTVLGKLSDIEEAYDVLLVEKESLAKQLADVSALKDKNEVEAVIRTIVGTEEDEFTTLLKAVAQSLSHVHSSVVTAIYREYSGIDVCLPYDEYEAQLSDAEARGYLNGEREPKWEETKIMMEIYESLEELGRYMRNMASTLSEKLFDEYGIPADIKNLGFWTEVIGVAVPLRAW